MTESLIQNVIVTNTEKDPIIVSIKNDIVYDIAKELYCYGDFSKIQSPKTYARQCVKNAIDFSDIYTDYINKG